MEILASGSWVTRERVKAIATVSAAAGVAMLLFLWLAGHGTIDFFGQPIGSDFTAFWNAGRLANIGEAPQAWNPDALNASVRSTHGVTYPTAWLYPPVFLLVAAPLAAMPYLAALLLWQTLSLGAIALTLNAILKDRRAMMIALASPLTPMVLAHGQNAFLTAALLGAGLVALDRRPRTAGSLLAGLVYKPQLGLVVAPLLIMTKRWRALAWGALTGIALIGLSLLLWGVSSWIAFANSLAISRMYMEQGAIGFYKSASLFAMARQWGAPVALGYGLQAAGLLAALWILFRARNASTNIRAAGVCAAAALSTPYLIDYDMAVVGLGAVFLYAEARRSAFAPYERSALAIIWIAPWFSRPAAQYLTIPLGPLAMLLLAWLTVRRMRQGIAIPPLTCSVCPVT
ncbi:MAG: hypothetical protein QOF34_225 [Sphingomonadales bacterium]|nr:hypothetical protein [Sphingomonadales bacterium]